MCKSSLTDDEMNFSSLIEVRLCVNNKMNKKSHRSLASQSFGFIKRIQASHLIFRWVEWFSGVVLGTGIVHIRLMVVGSVTIIPSGYLLPLSSLFGLICPVSSPRLLSHWSLNVCHAYPDYFNVLLSFTCPTHARLKKRRTIKPFFFAGQFTWVSSKWILLVS